MQRRRPLKQRLLFLFSIDILTCSKRVLAVCSYLHVNVNNLGSNLSVWGDFGLYESAKFLPIFADKSGQKSGQ